jgi:hypothetical protein
LPGQNEADRRSRAPQISHEASASDINRAVWVADFYGQASSNAKTGAGMAQAGVSSRVMFFVATIPR